MKLYLKVILTIIFTILSYTYFTKPMPSTVIDIFNLGVHEFGHLAANLTTNNFLYIVLWGTIMQLLIPIIFLVYFSYQKKWFEVFFVIFWIGINLIHIGVYIDDANCLCLPLLGDSDNHDWKYILQRFDIIEFADQIANFVRFFGKSFIGGSLLLMYLDIYRSYKNRLEKVSNY